MFCLSLLDEWRLCRYGFFFYFFGFLWQKVQIFSGSVTKLVLYNPEDEFVTLFDVENLINCILNPLEIPFSFKIYWMYM